MHFGGLHFWFFWFFYFFFIGEDGVRACECEGGVGGRVVVRNAPDRCGLATDACYNTAGAS